MAVLARAAAVILLIASVSGCATSKQAHDQATDYERRGLVVEAVEADLEALRRDRDFAPARAHLHRIGPKAYEQLLRTAETSARKGDWGHAVASYRKLQELLTRMRAVGIDFATVSIAERLADAERQAAEAYFVEANQLARDGRWNDAADAFLRADTMAPGYRGARDQAVAALTRGGEHQRKQGKVADALALLQRADTLAPGQAGVRHRIADCHLQIGRGHMTRQEYRLAADHFAQAVDFAPNLPGVTEALRNARDLATDHVAILPIAGARTAGISGFARTVIERVEKAELPYVRVFSATEVRQILGGRKLEAMSAAQIREVAAKVGSTILVRADLTRIEVKHGTPQVETHEVRRQVTGLDPDGNEITITMPVSYREVRTTHRHRVWVDAFIDALPSGEAIAARTLQGEVVEDLHWVEYDGPARDLPPRHRDLLQARRSPRPEQQATAEACMEIAHRLAAICIESLK